jgi:hypothetical protein
MDLLDTQETQMNLGGGGGSKYIPRYVNYSQDNDPPEASLHEFYEDVFYPVGNYANTSNQSIIRFDIKRDGWLDPTSCYFKMAIQLPSYTVLNSPVTNPLNGPSPLFLDVSYALTDLAPKTGNIVTAVFPNPFPAIFTGAPIAGEGAPFGNQQATDMVSVVQSAQRTQSLLQLESSVWNLFDEIIEYDGNNELRRARKFASLASVLKDMNYGANDRMLHQSKGYGGINAADFFSTAGSKTQVTMPFNDSTSVTPSFFNPFLSQYKSGSQLATQVAQIGYMSPCTTNMLDMLNQYSPDSIIPLTALSQANLLTAIGSGQAIYLPSSVSASGASGTANLSYADMFCGYAASFSQSFTTSTFEQILTGDIVQNYIYNGQTISQAISNGLAPNSVLKQTSIYPAMGINTYLPPIVNTHTFIVPFPSPWLGCLSPKEGKFIYLGGFKNLWFELRINPNAFFTSFYSGDNNFRRFVIKSIELHAQIAEYYDQTIQSVTAARLKSPEGLPIFTYDWHLSLQYPIKGSAVPKNVNVNTGYQSLKAYMFFFELQDFQNASCYREHWRVNHCLTSCRIKIGQTLLPSLEYKGNSGTNLGEINNYEFYQKLLQTFGKQFSSEDLAINPNNYALNQRKKTLTQQDVNNMNTCLKAIETFRNVTTAGQVPITNFIYTIPALVYGLASISATGNPIYSGVYQLTSALGTSVANLLSDMVGIGRFLEDFAFLGNLQAPYYFENQSLGKSVFCIDMDSQNYDGTIGSGISTVGQRPFDLLLSQDGATDNQQNASVLYGYGLYELKIICRLNENAYSEGVK